MMKKYFLLTLMLLLTASAFAVEVEIDGLWYEMVAKAKEAKVIQYKNDVYNGDIVIPETVVYEGVTYSVTSIGEGAFLNCTGLTSVTILASVTSIGQNAFFGCTGLTSVTIPNSVTSIGEGAFSWCSGLTSVTIPNSVTSIGSGAFENCSGLTSVTIPNSVTSIGERAFYGCSGLTSIIVDKDNDVYDSRESCNAIIRKSDNELVRGCNNTMIPNSVKSIGVSAFSGCSGLTSITIPNGVTSIGHDAFSGCSSLSSINLPNSITSIESQTFYHCNSLTSVTIPNSVTSIGNNAFGGCSSLTSITIPNSVKSIGAVAFWKCIALKSIKIPSSVTNIGNGVFSECISMTSIIVDSGNSVYDSREGCNAIIKTSENELVAGCKSTTIPNSVTSIGQNAFWGCRGLTSITIPNSVTSIGKWAFTHCSGLTNITIPNSVTSIGGNAFSEVNLNSVVSQIENPFRLYDQPFSENTLKNATLYVPAGTIYKYYATDGWKDFKNIVEMETSEYQLTYMVDGAEYKKYSIKEGETITPEPSPTKEGYTFSGWSNIPTTMPANDVTVTGSFSKNTYKLTYMVDGQVYKTLNYEYGAAIATVAAPTKEGYTFSGWSNTLLTMPARDVTISGTFSKNASSTYTLTYWVDGKEYKSVDYAPGAVIMAEPAPTKEGYEFSGWSNLPKTMPERDVTVTGSFSKKSYGNEDITKVIALILKGNATAEEMARYDMNHDGELNIGDIILIKRAMMENKVNGK